MSAAKVRFEVSPGRSRDGAFTLSWASAGEEGTARRFRVTEITGAGTRVIYEGADTARFQSGKPDGRYRYRVSALDASCRVTATSDEVTVRVDHHSLVKALAFFGLGAVVFGAIIVRIALGPDDR